MFRNRMLAGISFLPMFAPEDGSGGGAGGASGAGGAGAGGGAAAGGDSGAGGAGAAGAGAAAGGAAAGGAAGGAGGGAGSAGAASDPGGATLAGGGTGGTAAQAAAAAAALKPGELPTGFDFRAYLAGGDKDVEKDLAKYTDPKAIYQSLRDLQAKISKGELKAAPKPLAENATPEQKAEWRKSNGLPETAEAYVKNLALPDGVVIGAADKPLVENFAKAMFEDGAAQGEMNRAVSWFYKQQDAAEAARTQNDGATRVSSEVTLRGEWGPEFTPNMNAFGVFKAQMPAELQTAIFAARTPDGRMLGDTPEFLKMGAALGRMINPAATLIVPGGGDAGKTIGDEIKAIEATMYDGNGTPNREYWGDEKKQGRYRELIDMQTRMSAQGKAA